MVILDVYDSSELVIALEIDMKLNEEVEGYMWILLGLNPILKEVTL